MRKVRCERAARAVPERAGTGVSPSTTASSISSMEMAPSSPSAARSGRLSDAGGTRPSYGRPPTGRLWAAAHPARRPSCPGTGVRSRATALARPRRPDRLRDPAARRRHEAGARPGRALQRPGSGSSTSPYPLQPRFVDQQLEQDVAVFGEVGSRIAGDRAQFGVVQQRGPACDEEFPTRPECVRHAVVERVAPRSRRSWALGEVGSMKTNSRPPPTIGDTGWTLGVRARRRVAR